MKRFLLVVLILGLTTSLLAGESDPMEQALLSISHHFDSKTYLADQRRLVEADLAIPKDISLPLQTAELSYLRLLRNEIAARHGCIFDDKYLTIIFQGTSWYHPTTKSYVKKLNEFELDNMNFIEGKERKILIKGEREIQGWSTYSPPTYPSEREGRVYNKAELKILKVSPLRVRCGGEVKVRVRVTNLGINSWSPIGTTHIQEAGKYYVSSCWSDPKDPSEYCNVDQFPLPREIRPGESVEASGTVNAPKQTGTYALVFSMLQSMKQRFLDAHCPSAQYEYENCPKMMIRVVQ